MRFVKSLFLLLVSSWIFSQLVVSVHAQTPSEAMHVTLIINQVRGRECCSAGGVNELKLQVQELADSKLPATWALRYDALSDTELLRALPPQSAVNEYGALLEVTPALAKAAGVVYQGSADDWYLASKAFLIGYAPEDRVKLMDAYMAAFHARFNAYPKTVVSWMISVDSLMYLKQKYGVLLYERTREQWGTDTYTLYGGPPHYPYLSTESWAMVPTASDSGKIPLAVRQTITDPVATYGDITSTYTSQPNDYMRRSETVQYFQFLFDQAHNQPTEHLTFALMGLENSMDEATQKEFGKQLQHVTLWRNQTDHLVMTAGEFADWWSKREDDATTVYAGSDEHDAASRAWWITTPTYRVRLRLNNGELYISDLRLYDASLPSAYSETTATGKGLSIVPFLIDGSRFYEADAGFDFGRAVPDALANRKLPLPMRWTLATGLSTTALNQITLKREGETITIQNQGKRLASFSPSFLDLPCASVFHTSSQLSGILSVSPKSIAWMTKKGQWAWGLHQTAQVGSLCTWESEVHGNVLDQERQDRYPFLMPEPKVGPPDPKMTAVIVSNPYALAGRNPVRIVVYPHDSDGYPIMTKEEPHVGVDDAAARVTLTNQMARNWDYFIDIDRESPGKVVMHLTYGAIEKTQTVYFAPDCKHNLGYCFRHPIQAWWYIRNVIDDRMRAREQKQ